MTQAYILILLLYTPVGPNVASQNPTAIFSAEFSSKAHCDAAYDAMIKRGAGNAEMVCMPK